MTGAIVSGALVAWLCGLDRMAVLQIMISRPLVAAPLAGLVLGQPLVGLQVGLLIELLWLARLPMGAAVPPDDTQVAIAATVMAIILAEAMPAANQHGLALLCILTAIPVGKVGQFCEHHVRQFNTRQVARVDARLERGAVVAAEWHHLRGLLGFSLAALLTYGFILTAGLLLVPVLWPLLSSALLATKNWLNLALPLVGVAVILGTINVSRAITLFCAAFGMAFLMLWLVMP